MEIISNLVAPLAIIIGLMLSYALNKKKVAFYFYLVGFALLALAAFVASHFFVGVLWLTGVVFALYLALGKK